MSKKAAENALEQLYDEGWESIKPFFNDFDTFYDYLKRNQVEDKLTLKNLPEEIENKYTYVLFKEKPQETLDFIINHYLNDVEKKADGYYLRLRDRQEVSEFFRETRSENTRELVKNIMGEDWWEAYDYTTDDVYRDVIEELNPENLKYFKELVLKNLKDVKIDITGQSSDEMELIASEQGHDEYFFVTPENIDRIIADEDTMKVLLKKELDDIRHELYSIHSNAYNYAFTDEIWEDVMGELSTYFEPKFHSETIKMGDKQKWVEYLKIKDLPSIIGDFLYGYKDSEYSQDSIPYYGSFTGVLTHMMNEFRDYEFLDFRIPVHPDSSNVDKNVNEIFKDYI